MQIRIKPILKLFKEAFREWQQDKASLLAAALAYYTVFSVTPLLVIAIALASTAGLAIAGAVFGQYATRGELVQIE